ncbi:type II toxin-antitoxin system YafQ family toxin [Campylobacter mucosalis]|uniref:Putative toxin-antitoxin system, toxin component, YafQ family n=1 Tax=Campylobacter mucosalis CCUG 21559 TaxID=1032067 RepID=A0A6G5QHU7_9BACT|nr:type II toxin-antitoxin system YafQ family toxin [Campylobacter mucosalis]QCD45194.1 putative toxin-antitoxin system, toxin component, YafQ family [Campylobacter mucosalis CCUG 21559]
MYKIVTSKRYKIQFKKQSTQNQDLIDEVVFKLANGETLEQKHKDHQLKGRYKDFRECHIKPDLLLVYKIDNGVLALYLMQVGSHSDLF